MGRHRSTSLTEQDRYLLDRAVHQTEGLSAILDALLSLTQLQQTEPASEWLDLEVMLDEVDDALGGALESAGAEITLRGNRQLHGHPTLVPLLLRNLLTNAVKYRDPVRPLHLCIEVGTTEQAQILAVTDNGRGIDAAEFGAIFEMFGRGAAGAETGGTGIGLATCRAIATQHGGSIRAEPRDVGARFVIELPLPPPAAAPPPSH